MFDRIHHAGLAVSDLDTAQRVFAGGLGLRVDTTRSPLPHGNQQRGPDPTDILDVPIGTMELELNVPVGEDTGTGRFLANRGGVGALHHICLHTDNISDDIAHLRASGIQQIAASPEELASNEPWRTVAFFHPRDCLGILLEIWPTDNHHVGDSLQGDGVFTRMDHIGTVTNDLERARHFWCNVIGLRVDTLKSPIGRGRHVESDNVDILDIPIGKGEIVCINPRDGTSGTARFLERFGGRAGGTMHHISLATRDVKAAVDYVEGNGLKRIGVPSNDIAWIHPDSAAGVLIEIVKDES